MPNANNASVGVKYLPTPAELQFLLDRGNTRYPPERWGAQFVRGKKNTIKCVYDFSVQGGGIGVHNLIDSRFGVGGLSPKNFIPYILPVGAVITRVLVDVLTAPTSGGSATISLCSGLTDADILAATAVASFTGFIDGIPVGASTALKVVSAPTGVQGVIPYMKVAVAALTAGKFNVHVDWVLSD